MSTEVRQIRCSSCGYSGPPNVVWAIRAFCPRCLAPIPISAEWPPSNGADDGQAERQRAVVAGWIEAFNARDLEGMLARMRPRVELHPLQLADVNGVYRGHPGVREWFEHLMEGHRDQSLVPSKFRHAGTGRLITVGQLRLDRDSDPRPFRFLDIFNRGRIAASYHFLARPSSWSTVG